jgi:hypothetical protein
MKELMENCLVDCMNTHQITLETITYCLEKGGEYANAEHIKLLMDCAEICQTSANFMLRGSTLHKATCQACAEISRSCAASCDRFGENDEQLKSCAAACYKCAESCEAMAKSP